MTGDDGELLLRAARDMAAFEAVYRRFVGNVTAFAVSRCTSAADQGITVYWVEPDTYRPIKHLWYGGTPTEMTETYTYLARTPQNLGLLEPNIPDDYQDLEGHT